MNDNARKWCEALKSGAYVQATGALLDRGAYCCLGVACELFRLSTGTGEWIREEFLGECAELPLEVQEWLQLDDDLGHFYCDEDRTSLADLNDAGKTFDDIAAIIESEPPGLFALPSPSPVARQ